MKKTKRKRVKTIRGLLTLITKNTAKGKWITIRFIDHEDDGDTHPQTLWGEIIEYNTVSQNLTFKTHGTRVKIPLFSSDCFISAIIPENGKEYYSFPLHIPKNISREKWNNVLNDWILKSGEGHEDFIIK